MAAGFPQNEQPKKYHQGKRHSIFYNLIRSDIPLLVSYSVGHTHNPWHNVGGDYTRVWILGGRII